MQIISVVQFIFEAYSFILLGRVLLSWLPIDPYNPIARVLVQLTEPVLAPIRRLLPPAGMMDFSPIVAFILLIIIERVVISMLASTLR